VFSSRSTAPVGCERENRRGSRARRDAVVCVSVLIARVLPRTSILGGNRGAHRTGGFETRPPAALAPPPPLCALEPVEERRPQGDASRNPRRLCRLELSATLQHPLVALGDLRL